MLEAVKDLPVTLSPTVLNLSETPVTVTLVPLRVTVCVKVSSAVVSVFQFSMRKAWAPTVQVAIIIAGAFEDVAERLGVAGGLVDDFTVEHALVMAVDGDVVGELALSVDTGDGLGALPVVTTGVRKGDVPTAIVGARDNCRGGSGSHGDDCGDGETHVDGTRDDLAGGSDCC